MIINIIEFMICKYYNKIVKYIRQNIKKKILIDILMQNKNFHKSKF